MATLFGQGLVEWSVAEANRLSAGKTIQIGACPQCGVDRWRTRHGIDEQFRSEFNPGEFCEFTCDACGYSDGPQMC